MTLFLMLRFLLLHLFDIAPPKSAPGVEGDAGHPGGVALAPGEHAVLGGAEEREQVVLAARRQEAPVRAPRAAQRAAVVRLRTAHTPSDPPPRHPCMLGWAHAVPRSPANIVHA